VQSGNQRINTTQRRELWPMTLTFEFDLERVLRAVRCTASSVSQLSGERLPQQCGACLLHEPTAVRQVYAGPGQTLPHSTILLVTC